MASFAESVSDTIWRGRQAEAIVALRSAEYQSEPEHALLRYACTLYSYRYKRACKEALRELQMPLLERAKNWTRNDSLDEAESLATYLAWLSRQPEQPPHVWSTLYKWSWYLCEEALWESDKRHESGHTQCLLGLTMAGLALDHSNHEGLRKGLCEAKSHHRHIRDQRQKARIYRGLALIYYRMDNRPVARRWALEALFIGGVPPMVRVKTLAALMGWRA